jgi:hypothetical protein
MPEEGSELLVMDDAELAMRRTRIQNLAERPV